MNLEDHVGDIISKARGAAKVTVETAARAAGLSESDLSLLEQTGQVTTVPNFQALAGILGLDATKLERIAKGWLPQVPELSTWRELRPISTVGGGYAVNSFLIWDEVTLDAALFDTGFEADEVFKLIVDNRLSLQHLFLTHLHHDHVGAIDAVRQQFPRIHIHASSTSFPPQQRNRASDFIHLGNLRISNRATPGHSAEGTTYVVGNWPGEAAHVAIVGDALFAGSMGRGMQSWELARQNAREQILTLPPNTLICPGHGPLTTVAQEVANNPFF